jgi:two-component system NtrC family sensor kinase
MLPADRRLAVRADPRAVALFRRLSRAAALVVILVGSLVLAGWTLDVATAVGFVLAGAALWLLHAETASRRVRYLAGACAALTALLGLLTLGEYLLRAGRTSQPGRMTPTTALEFVLLGVALLLLNAGFAFRRAQSLSLVAGLVALLAATGHLYGVTVPYGIASYTQMAMHTALAFVVLSVGVLFARPERGVMGIVASEGAGGIMARRLLPTVVAVPIALSWLRLWGERVGFYGTEFGLSLVVVSSIAVFVALIWSYASSMDWAAAERERGDEVSRRSAAMFRDVLESVADAIVIADGQGRIVTVNTATVRLFGYTREELLGRPVEMLLPERARDAHVRHRAAYHAAPRTRPMSADLDLLGRRKDGSEFPVEISLSPLQTEGELLITSVVRDVSERKRAEEALRQSEKLAALGSLLAGVAHELNNPLSVILGHARLLAQSLQGRAAERAEKITAAAERCARIVRTFLALARQHPPERQGVAVGEIVGEAVELLAYQLRVDSVEVSLDLADDLQRLWADPHQLHQVFVNLITNAHQAMSRTPPPRRLAITARTDPARARLSITVTDTGPGIPAEVRSRIFEPFFTTKPPGQGTGLGLSLCQGIVEDHGGTLTVESAPGHGAVFRIELPVTSPPAHAAAGHVGASLPPIRDKAILIVDDEPEVGALLADLLAADGHRADIAPNGARALEMIQAGTYDLVLSDMRMPDLDGPSLYRRLESLRHPLAARFIFVTGDVLGEDTRRFLEESRALCVSKPFSLEELRSVLAAAFQRREVDRKEAPPVE